MRHNRPQDFGRKDSPIEYDMQGKPRLPANMRTGYAAGGFSSLSSMGGRDPIGTLLYDSQDSGDSGRWDPRTTVRKMGPSQPEQLEDILGVLQKSGYGPAGRGGGFDADYYLRNNPDVAQVVGPGGAFAGYDPYIHYNLYGRNEGRLGSAPAAAAGAAAPQSTLAGLTPVGGGGAAPSFNANADLAAQQATGAATLAQMRGSGPSPAAPAAPAAPQQSFTPSATGNAPPAGGQQSFTPSATGNAAPPRAMAAGGAVGSWDPVSESYLDPSMGLEKIPTAAEAERRHQARMGPDLLKDRDLMSPDLDNIYAQWEGTNKKKRGYAGGGMVEELGPRQSMSPQSMIPPAGGGPALNRFGMNRGRAAMRRGYAHGGEVDDQAESRAEDTYVTGDQLAKQVEERFSQALETDDKYRRGYARGGTVGKGRYDNPLPESWLPLDYASGGSRAEGEMPRNYDDGGYIEEGTATGGTAEAAAEEARRRLEEMERQRMAEAAAEAERESARRPAPEQAPPEEERRTDPSDTSRLLPEPPALPPEDAAPQPAASPDGVPSPAQPAAVADAQAQAEQQTNDWLAKVIDYGHSKIDPAEFGPQQPQPEAARTGYAPEERPSAGGGRGPLMAGMASMPNWISSIAEKIAPERKPVSEAAGPAGPATPPAPPPTASPAESIPSLLGGVRDAAYDKIRKSFASDKFEDKRPFGAEVKMKLSEFLSGKDALHTVEQLQQIQQNDPAGEHGPAFQRLSDHFEKTNNIDAAHKLSQSMRNPYAGLIATAQAANAAQNPEATARLLDRAHNFLTNKTFMKTTPTESGFDITLTSEVDGTSQQRSLTRDQMTEFLNSGTQYDAMAKNSTLKHLDIATGRRGQFNTDISSLPVSDERTGYTPQEPPMTQGAPRTSDYTTVPPPAAEPSGPARPPAAANANPLAPMTVPIPTGYNPPPATGDVGGKPRHPAWEGLPVADKWESGKGYRAPQWPNQSMGPENYGMFARASGPAHQGITLGRNEATQSVGPYIPAGGDQGALRIPPGGRAPPGWRAFPAEDAHEGSGQIALPPGVAPNVRDVTMYRSDGTPVAMKVPDFWDPNKIKYEKEGRDSGQAVFPNPPGTKYNESGAAVRPISSYAPTLATPAPGREPGAPAPIGRGGQDFGVKEPWRPTYGRGSAGPPPPDDDRSPDAVAARRRPDASQWDARAKDALALDALASKETTAETAAGGRLGAADITGRYRTAASSTLGQSRENVAGINQAGAMDRAQFNAGARATAASEKFDHEMKKLETREGGLNDRAAMRDATNRYKIETISSDKGREIAQKALTAQQMKDLSIYQTKIANGQAQTPAEVDSYNTFRDAMVRNGFRVPPEEGGAPAPARPGAAAPTQGGAGFPGPRAAPGAANAGAAVNQTAQSLAGGQATAASATPKHYSGYTTVVGPDGAPRYVKQ